MVDPYLVQNMDFLTTLDVACPKCRVKAFVLCDGPGIGVKERKKSIHFSCPDCGYVLKYSNIPKFMGGIHNRNMHPDMGLPIVDTDCDPYFGFDLWYRKETAYGLLWAYNLDHLTAIENYISDKRHSHNNIPEQDNGLAGSWFQWMKTAEDREYLLRAIQKLRQK